MPLVIPRRLPGLQATESGILFTRHASATRGSPGLNPLGPDLALLLASDWLFLGPELSWLATASFCAHHIHYRAGDARLAPRKSCQLPCVTASLLAAAVMWTTTDTRGRSPLPAYGLRLTDGNERSPINVSKISPYCVARGSGTSASVDER